MGEEQNTVQAEPKPSFLKRFWWIGLIIVVGLGGAWAVMSFVVHPKGSSSGDHNNSANSMKSASTIPNGSSPLGKYPACPSNLSGVLTYQLMDAKNIGGMLPLGNVSPPGHTSPVDHIYFSLNTDEKIPLYAPANGWITNVMANSIKDANGNYVFDAFNITYTICDGLVLDFSGYTDVSQSLKDEFAKHQDACKSDIQKVGHDNTGEQQCDYKNLDFKVTSGEQIGWTQRTKKADGSYSIPFEIWAADYNKVADSAVDWTYYNDDRYPHSMCTFDLYSGDLKKQFDAKFGSFGQSLVKDPITGKDTPSEEKFIQRTMAPLCGTINQNVTNTIAGMWFSGKPNLDDKSGDVVATGQGMSFIHNNVDPTKGEVVVGGEMSNGLTGTLAYTPTHSGTINREPSEVKADGQIYCYQSNTTLPNNMASVTDKILVQLTDNSHLKAENQSGTCAASESFTGPFNFER